MLLRVGFYNWRYIFFLKGHYPVIVPGLYHCIDRSISLICSGEFYFIPCILKNYNRGFLKLLYSAPAILGCDLSLKVFVVISVQGLSYKEVLLVLFGKILWGCPGKKPQLRGSYAEINMPACSLSIMKLSQKSVLLLGLQKGKIPIVSKIRQSGDHQAFSSFLAFLFFL